MIASLLVLLAAAPQAEPSVAGILRGDDYPTWAADEGQQGSVGFELLVGPDGKVERCTVLVSTGHPELDSYTCDLLKKRASFAATVNAQGKPAYGVYRNVVSWSLDSPAAPMELAPDLELQISRAPTGVSLPLEFSVSYMSSPTGAVSGCRLAYKAKPAPKVLLDIACRAFSSGPPEIVRNVKGEPVDAWIVSTVRFTQDPISRSTALSPASP